MQAEALHKVCPEIPECASKLILLSGLQKLEQWAKKYIELLGKYVE
jgi:hypothetical protein